ncbi:UNVERIFIED_CONTAM: hypothetical protein GTU68_024432 [Idotea baltica]|nr:hypothetical protein [Idotea baltica]
MDHIKKAGPVFVFAICKGTQDEMEKTVAGTFGGDIERQLDQAKVLIKSATTLASHYLRFVILVDQDYLFDDLSNKLSMWPVGFRKRFELIKRHVWFPEDRQEFRTIYRVCSTERVFIISQLPDFDSVIYLDTDMIFMRPPEDLWNHFYQFDSHQLCGMAPNLNHYDSPKIKFPYYGSTGLNAGLWMMNLTRMRNFPGGWINTCMNIYEKYREFRYFNLIDQDVANVIFSQSPRYLFELECQWNYRLFLCSKGVNKCKESNQKGISLVHGNALSFYAEKDMKLKRLYEVWRDFQVGGSLRELLNTLKISLKEVDELQLKSDCSKIRDFDNILTKGLERYIQSLEH